MANLYIWPHLSLLSFLINLLDDLYSSVQTQTIKHNTANNISHDNKYCRKTLLLLAHIKIRQRTSHSQEQGQARDDLILVQFIYASFESI